MTKDLTIVVPAYNEQNRLAKTVNEISEIADEVLTSWEIILVNDGSTDRTLEIASSLKDARPNNIQILDLPKNKGVGNAFLLGLGKASKEFITLIPGDNAFAMSGIRTLFSFVGDAELVISYRSNPAARTFFRRWLSRFATLVLRLISGRQIRDAHSMFVYPVRAVRKFKFSPGYGYHMETLSRMLLIANSLKEVPVELNPKPDASSGVMRMRTLCILGSTAIHLLWLRVTGRLV